MRITSKGQVTIPVEIRERLGLKPHTEVEFEIERGAARLRKVPGSNRRARQVVTRMRGSATVRMSTDAILARTRR
jgi:AbrB family looped-hinge helix DNA binding protein